MPVSFATPCEAPVRHSPPPLAAQASPAALQLSPQSTAHATVCSCRRKLAHCIQRHKHLFTDPAQSRRSLGDDDGDSANVAADCENVADEKTQPVDRPTRLPPLPLPFPRPARLPAKLVDLLLFHLLQLSPQPVSSPPAVPIA